MGQNVKPTREQFLKQGNEIYQKLASTPILARRLPPRAEFEKDLNRTWNEIAPMDQDSYDYFCMRQQAASMPVLESLRKGLETAVEARKSWMAEKSWYQKIGIHVKVWWIQLWNKLRGRKVS
jgi:hypothetical protein